MNVLIIDDEPLEMNSLKDKISKLIPDASLYSFTSSREAVECCESTSLDIAFLDVELDTKINGVDIAKLIREHSPLCNLIFTTGFKQYAFDAVGVRASGYLVKPISVAALKKELDHLRVPLASSKLKVVTFGSFDVFDDSGKRLKFSRKTSKEVFAYLIMKRGEDVSSKDICRDVFEVDFDLSQSKVISQYLHDLMNDLEEVGFGEVILKERQSVCVDTSLLDCDYYHFLDGDKEAKKMFHDEFMSNYSWAEPICSDLMDMMEEDY